MAYLKMTFTFDNEVPDEEVEYARARTVVRNYTCWWLAGNRSVGFAWEEEIQEYHEWLVRVGYDGRFFCTWVPEEI